MADAPHGELNTSLTIETRADVHQCPTGSLSVESEIERLSLGPAWNPADTGALRRDTESGLGSSHSAHSNGSPTSAGSQRETPRSGDNGGVPFSAIGQEVGDDIKAIGRAGDFGTSQTDGLQQQPKGSLMKLAVRRYMGKDRLFHLVHTLLASEREEKRATEEYIASLSSARTVTDQYVPAGDKNVVSSRYQRIKKRRRESLANRIQNQRKSIGREFYQNEADSGFTTHGDINTGSTSIHVEKHSGQSDCGTTTETEQHKYEDTVCETAIDHNGDKQSPIARDANSLSGGNNGNTRVTFDTGDESAKDNELVANTTIESIINDIECHSEFHSAAQHSHNTELHRSKTKSASDDEKKFVSEELKFHKDRDILDTLILKYVMENTSSNLVPTLGRRLKELKVQVNTKKRFDKGNQCNGNAQVDPDTQLNNAVEIQVEPDSDSDDQSTDSDYYSRRPARDIIGMDDETQSETTDETMGNIYTDIDDDSGYGIIYHNVSNGSTYTTSGHCRQSSNLQRPCLETINEAEQSAESFQSLGSSRNVFTNQTVCCDSVHYMQPGTVSNMAHNSTQLPVIPQTIVNTRSNSKHFPAVETKLNDKRIPLDLIEVYETNQCLQKVNTRASKYRLKETKHESPVTVVRLPKRKRRWSTVPMPPKQTASRSTQTRPKSNLPSVNVPQTKQNNTDHLFKQYKRYQSTKEYLRHSRPDSILLSKLETDNGVKQTEVTPSTPVCKEEIVETTGCHADVASVRRIAANRELIRALDLKQRCMRSERVERIYRNIRASSRNRGCYSARSAHI